MFHFPDAKRIRRSDLYTVSRSASPTSAESDAEIEAQLRARLASIYGSLPSIALQFPSTSDDGPAHLIGGDARSEQGEREFEFRLFSTTGAGNDHRHIETQKIILGDSEEHTGDGGFVVRERSRGYYFMEKADEERQLGYESMALSGEEVLSRAQKRAWGLEVPWRVRVLKIVGKKGEGNEAVGLQVTQEDLKRKRPGKKRRIILREQKKSKEMLQEQKKAENQKREEAEREKRTRRNREKKVKRKMKEKAKKAGSSAEETASIELEKSLIVDTGD